MGDIAVILDTCTFENIDPYKLVEDPSIDLFTSPYVLAEIKTMESSIGRATRSRNFCHAVEIFSKKGDGKVLEPKVCPDISHFLPFLPKAHMARIKDSIGKNLPEREINVMKKDYTDRVCDEIRRVGSFAFARSARYLGNLFEISLRDEISSPGSILGHHGREYHAHNDANHVGTVFQSDWAGYNQILLVSSDSDTKGLGAIANCLYDRKTKPVEPVHTRDFMRYQCVRHLFDRRR